MFNLDYITNENNKEHNSKWLYIPDHPYKILIIVCSGSRKTNALFNLIKQQDSDNLIDKIHLYAKDLNEPKYQFFIKRREDVGIKYLNDPKAFIEHSNAMDDVYEDINEHNPARERKVPKEVRLNSTRCLIMKIYNKKELQNIATNHWL